jgi:Tol biopolymer transport system component
MPTYSPDRAEVAYISPDGLSVAAADGSGARVLIPGALDKDFTRSPYGLSWSPTGDRIAFGKATGESTEWGRESTELTVLDVASGSVKSLADMGGGGTIHHIKFSPEGDRILFTRTDAEGESSIWSIHADGSDPQRLVDGTGTGDWQTVTPKR